MSNLFSIPKLGNLQLDKVFFETYYPILFTCLNEKKELFLCVCCRANHEGKKWLITKTKPHVVIAMLKNEITIRNAMIMYEDVRVTIIDKGIGEEVTVAWYNEQDWDIENSVSLPAAGEFLDAEDEEYEEELAYFYEMHSKNTGGEIAIVENILPQKLVFGQDFYIDFLDSIIEGNSVRNNFKAELYRTVYDIMSKKFEQEVLKQDTFLIDVEEDEDALILIAA